MSAGLSQARPGLEAIHFLEKLRARGCSVFYIKPDWLKREEERIQRELQELWAEADAAAGTPQTLNPKPYTLNPKGSAHKRLKEMWGALCSG